MSLEKFQEKLRKNAGQPPPPNTRGERIEIYSRLLDENVIIDYKHTPPYCGPLVCYTKDECEQLLAQPDPPAAIIAAHKIKKIFLRSKIIRV